MSRLSDTRYTAKGSAREMVILKQQGDNIAHPETAPPSVDSFIAYNFLMNGPIWTIYIYTYKIL